MISIKTAAELDNIRAAGSIIKKVFSVLSRECVQGASTWQLDTIAENAILSDKGELAFKGYKGYPACICTSVNDSVVHEIPDKSRILKNGDIISIDVGVGINGYFADAAVTFGVGQINQEARKLIDATRRSLDLGLLKAVEGNRVSDISNAVQRHVEDNGFNVVRYFVGHGIGKCLHEAPEIPNFGPANRGERLKEGMVLAIEPMVNAGGHEIRIMEDGWKAVTKDGSLSAHFEHTVIVGKTKAEIVT